jgi:hypothetical protein
MKRQTRSLLDEISVAYKPQDREAIIESRANHIISSAINLVNLIRESYDSETAGELERRLLNSIRGQDTSKFMRGIRKAGQ